MVGCLGVDMDVVGGMQAGQARGWSHVGRCLSTFRMRGDTLMTRITPPSRCVAQGRVEQELVGHPGMTLAWDATRRLRFVVPAAGWLHSMVLHGRRCC